MRSMNLKLCGQSQRGHLIWDRGSNESQMDYRDSGYKYKQNELIKSNMQLTDDPCITIIIQ